MITTRCTAALAAALLGAACGPVARDAAPSRYVDRNPIAEALAGSPGSQQERTAAVAWHFTTDAMRGAIAAIAPTPDGGAVVLASGGPSPDATEPTSPSYLAWFGPTGELFAVNALPVGVRFAPEGIVTTPAGVAVLAFSVPCPGQGCLTTGADALASGSQVAAFSPTGPISHRALGDGVVESIAAGPGGEIAVARSRDDGTIVVQVLDPRDGQVIDVDPPGFGPTVRLAFLGNGQLVSARGSTLASMSRAGGLLWSVEAGGALAFQHVVARGGIIAVAGSQGPDDPFVASLDAGGATLGTTRVAARVDDLAVHPGGAIAAAIGHQVVHVDPTGVQSTWPGSSGIAAEAIAVEFVGDRVVAGGVLNGSAPLVVSLSDPWPERPVPTWSDDVAPIVAEKCVGCHQAGGVAPFRLDRSSDARGLAGPIRAAVEARRMPPWGVNSDGTCGEFADSRALTDAQIDTIARWVRAGAPEGSGGDIVVRPPPTLTGAVDLPLPEFTPDAHGGMLSHDEYRCFLVDPGLPQDAYITAYDVRPGSAALVHHVMGFVVDPGRRVGDSTNGDLIAALDAASPDRPGWPCYGGAGERVVADGTPVTWAPGQGVVTYPDGIGVAIRPSDRLVIQVHYHLDETRRPESDRTTLRVRFAPTVARRAYFLLVDDLLASLAGTPALLEPGNPSVPFESVTTPAAHGLALRYADLVGVMPHMHRRGRRFKLRIGPEATCAAEVKQWDIRWQLMYFYSRPRRLGMDTPIHVRCEYDTSRDLAPVSPGWSSDDEMCLAVLMLAAPPDAPVR
jgi:hypothetical protein